MIFHEFEISLLFVQLSRCRPILVAFFVAVLTIGIRLFAPGDGAVPAAAAAPVHPAVRSGPANPPPRPHAPTIQVPIEDHPSKLLTLPPPTKKLILGATDAHRHKPLFKTNPISYSCFEKVIQA